MLQFLLAFVVFIAAHTVPTRPPIRRHLVNHVGERGFQAIYSIVSLVLLAWLIAAAIEAPYVELWPPAAWQMYVAIALMPPAFMLTAIGLGVPNPLSISLYPAPGDWRPSGVLRFVRHPLLVGLALWAGLHVLASGALVAVLMFAGFALFALAGVKLVVRRRRLELGTEAYDALGERRGDYDDGRRQAVAATLGLVAYGVLLVLHPWLFGADPLAWV